LSFEDTYNRIIELAECYIHAGFSFLALISFNFLFECRAQYKFKS